jgi:hypothetical protein
MFFSCFGYCCLYCYSALLLLQLSCKYNVSLAKQCFLTHVANGDNLEAIAGRVSGNKVAIDGCSRLAIHWCS